MFDIYRKFPKSLGWEKVPPVLHAEDMLQMNEDDMEYMALSFDMAMLSLRTRKFLQKTGRKEWPKPGENGANIGWDKSRSRCWNCNLLGHYSRECPQPRRDPAKPANGKGIREVPIILPARDDTQALATFGYHWDHEKRDAEKGDAHALVAEVKYTLADKLAEIRDEVQETFDNLQTKIEANTVQGHLQWTDSVAKSFEDFNIALTANVTQVPSFIFAGACSLRCANKLIHFCDVHENGYPETRSLKR